MEVDEDDNIDGIILSIAVKNFFCHDSFRIDFVKNVTYLVGRNGSGKSAVVTALVVGLGGKAAATSRGTSLSSFIKKGADSASVEIKIKNSSPMAYKHSVYGDSITVIHDFSVNGSSTYKVKSHKGEVISTKHQDVQDIVLAHNIQVDNPISVLNQDEARSFHDNEPHKQYTFLRRATNLDKTEKYYKEALDLCKKAENKLNSKKHAAKELEKEYTKWDTLHKKMLSRQEIEQQKKALDNEYYWGEVVELERALREQEEKQQQRAETIERLQEALEKLAAHTAAETQCESALSAAVEARAEAEKREQAATRALGEGEAAARRRDQAARELRARRALEERKLRDLRAEIENMGSGGGAAARAQLEARAAACAAAAEEARARLATAEHAAAQARQAAVRARDHADDAQEGLPALRDATTEARRQLQALRGGADSLAVFGPEMAELRRRIDRHNFRQRPRGPVGAHIKLRDRKWGSAMEHILGNSLTAFCADNGQDARTLKNIIEDVYGRRGGKPSVSFSGFRARAHDVSRNAVRAPAGTTGALDAVRIDDPVVANYLIDNLALETVLLAPDDDTAMQLTSSARAVPAHLRRVVTRECAEFFPAPNYRSYGGRARPVQFLNQDVADRARQLQAEVEACEEAERAAAAAAEAAAAARRAADDALRGEERALRALRAAAADADARLADAQAELRAHHAPTVDALEEEIRVSEERLQKISAQEQALADGEGGAGGQVGALRAALKAASEELQRARQLCSELQERAQKQQMEREQAAGRAQSLQQRMERVRAEMEEASATLAADAAAVNAKRAAASKLCPRIENPRSTRVVRALAVEAGERLREELGEMSRAAVGERLVAATRRRAAVRHALERNRRLILEIQEVTNHHLMKCCLLQKDIVRNVQASFKCMLDRRNYTGALKVDMSRGRLMVECAPSGKRAGGTAALSGGERSYATVALLMALWECVELPFFFLDEFDVFMDPVNRKEVMKLLEEHAVRRRGRQFVFLTPQDGTAIRENDFISIRQIRR